MSRARKSSEARLEAIGKKLDAEVRAIDGAKPLDRRVAELEARVDRLAAIVTKAASAVGTFVNMDPFGIEQACDVVESEALLAMSSAGRLRYRQEMRDREFFADEEEPAST